MTVRDKHNRELTPGDQVIIAGGWPATVKKISDSKITISLDLVNVDPVSVVKLHVVSCGCCTNGCTCHNHMDIPRGIRPQKCEQHSGTGEVRFLNA